MYRTILRIASLTGASLFQVGALAILSMILAKVMTTEAFGVTRVVTSYLAIMFIIAHGCLHDAVASYVGSAETYNSKMGYSTTGTLLVLLLSILSSGLLFFTFKYGGLWESRPLQTTMLSIVWILPMAAVSTLHSGILQAIGSYRALTINIALGGGVPLLVISLGSYLYGLEGWVLGRYTSTAILLVIVVYSVRHYLGKVSDFNHKIAKQLGSFAIVQLGSGVLSMFMQNADIIALERLNGNMVEIAQYGMATLFTKSILFIPGSIGRVYFKDIANSSSNVYKLKAAITKLLLINIIVCSLLAVLVYCIAPIFIASIYGDKYSRAIPVINVLCLGIVFNGIWGALSVITIATRKPIYAVCISFTGALVAVIALIIYIDTYGAIGAAWAMNAAYASGSLVGVILVIRMLMHEVYNSKSRDSAIIN